MAKGGQIVRLLQTGGQPTLEVEFVNEDAINTLATQYKSADRIVFQAMEFPPPITQIEVTLRWKGASMSFNAAILSWRPGAAALKPAMDPYEFQGRLERLRSHRKAGAQPAGQAPVSAAERVAPMPPAAPPEQESLAPPPAATMKPRPARPAAVEDKATAFLQSLQLDPTPLKEGTATGDDSILWLEGTPTSGQEACLEAEAPDGKKWYVFARNGMPVRAYLLPSTRRTSLVRLLQQQKQLSEEQVLEVLTLAERERIPEEAALSRAGMLPPEFVEKAAQAKLRLLLAKLAHEPTVTFSIRYTREIVATAEPLETPIPAAPPVATSEQVPALKDAIDKYCDYSWEAATGYQNPYLSDCPKVKGDPQLLAESLKLGEKGTRFLINCLNGETALRNVYKTTNLSRKNTFALIFGLHELGMLDFDERPIDELLTEELIRIVGERFNSLKKGSLFDRLDLHWSSTGEEIEEATEHFLKHLSTATPSRVGAEAAGKAEAVMDGIREAAAVLKTNKGRIDHRLTFLEPFNVMQAIDLINSHLEMAVYRIDKKEMNRLLLRITELSPAIGRAKRAECAQKLAHRNE